MLAFLLRRQCYHHKERRLLLSASAVIMSSQSNLKKTVRAKLDYAGRSTELADAADGQTLMLDRLVDARAA